jgi:hypothetical protein
VLSTLDCAPLSTVAAADLGCSVASRDISFSGTGGFSVCGAAGICDREVSILSVLALIPDNLRLRTEADSLLAVVGRGVASEASISWDDCISGTDGRAPEGGGRAGSELDGAGARGGEWS